MVGQAQAKRAVAIALRNRWRRQQLSAELREEVLPKNILMIGPTGVGKTEIARRLAKLARENVVLGTGRWPTQARCWLEWGRRRRAMTRASSAPWLF